MKLADALRDLARYCVMPDMPVKVEANAAIGAWNKHPSAVLQAVFAEPVETTSFGIPHMPLLGAVLAHPDYLACDARVVTAAGVKVLALNGADGAVSTIKIHSGEWLKHKIYQVGKLLPMDWGVGFAVTTTAVDLLHYWLPKAEMYENADLTLHTRRGKLYGRFGGHPIQSFEFSFARVAGVVEPHFAWDGRLLFKLLSLSSDATVTVTCGLTQPALEGDSSNGVLKVEVQTDLARYTYLLPGTRVHQVSLYEDLHAALERDFAERRMAEIVAAEEGVENEVQ